MTPFTLITRSLTRHLRQQSVSSILMPNVFVGTSPWESDLVRITPALYWTEYEIKVSISDYRADFTKKAVRYDPNSISKHRAYAAESPIEIRSWCGNRPMKIIPKPKQFYFVVPRGLLRGVDVPAHCGIIEVEGNAVCVIRTAPNLKAATRLDTEAVFGIAVKASHRVPVK